MRIRFRQIVLSFLAILLAATEPMWGQGTSRPAFTANASGSGDPNQSSSMVPGNGRSGRLKKILLPDGYIINGRPAVLIKHPSDDRWFFKFERSESEQKPGVPLVPNGTNGSTASPHPATTAKSSASSNPFDMPMEILPCHQLAILTDIAKTPGSSELRFRVWAEVTTYRGRNYLVPREIYNLQLFGNAEDVPASASKNILDRMAPAPAASTEQKDGQSDVPDSEDPELNRVRQMLLQMPRPRPYSNSGASGAASGPGESEPMTPPTVSTVSGPPRGDLLDAAVVVDRVGRVGYDPDGQRWLFAFEADGASLAEPPVVLLPNALLERLETSLAESDRSVRFRVSGEITKYQQANYLILRKALIKFENANLGKQ